MGSAGVSLEDLALRYREIVRLCPCRPTLDPETVRDVVTGRSPGTLRTWEGIVAALNAMGSSELYTLEDLLGGSYEVHRRRWLEAQGAGAPE